MVPTFSSFTAIDHKGHFWKKLTRIFKLGCFPWYHAYIFETKWVRFPGAEQNTVSIDINFKSQKWKSRKILFPFLIALFHFETNFRSFLFFGPFWTVAKFLPSPSERWQLAGSDKKKFLLINLVPRVPFFYEWGKLRLKNRVTAVHLLPRRTNFLIHICFWRRNLCQIKKHLSWEASINLKKGFLIRLHSSTFV